MCRHYEIFAEVAKLSINMYLFGHNFVLICMKYFCVVTEYLRRVAKLFLDTRYELILTNIDLF